jgi:hypothetical protein
MENLNEAAIDKHMDETDRRRAYKDFINKNSMEIEITFNNLNKCVKDAFDFGFAEGKESNRINEKVKLRISVIENLIKYTQLDDLMISKIVEVTEERWIKLIKEKREKIVKSKLS